MSAGWVCLLYHDVAPRQTDYFATPAPAFAAQLDALRAAGYRGCSISAALAADPGARCAALSFDDGNLGQYAAAFPALAERGMTATFFITTSWVGRPGYVRWDQLREMRAAGMSIQSHTRTHPFLSELGASALVEELRAAKTELDHALGQDTDSLALPGGDFPRRRYAPLVLEAGYRVVATSLWGVNRGDGGRDGWTEVRRCTVRGEPPLDEFRRVLAGDPSLGRLRRGRERVLGTLRRSLGPSRYARWRRWFLERVGGTA